MVLIRTPLQSLKLCKSHRSMQTILYRHKEKLHSLWLLTTRKLSVKEKQTTTFISVNSRGTWPVRHRTSQPTSIIPPLLLLVVLLKVAYLELKCWTYCRCSSFWLENSRLSTLHHLGAGTEVYSARLRGTKGMLWNCFLFVTGIWSVFVIGFIFIVIEIWIVFSYCSLVCLVGYYPNVLSCDDFFLCWYERVADGNLCTAFDSAVEKSALESLAWCAAAYTRAIIDSTDAANTCSSLSFDLDYAKLRHCSVRCWSVEADIIKSIFLKTVRFNLVSFLATRPVPQTMQINEKKHQSVGIQLTSPRC